MNPGSGHALSRSIPDGRREIGVWLPLTVFFAGILLTTLIWLQERRIALNQLHNSFDYASRLDLELLRQRLTAHEQMLRGVQGFFNGSEQVDRREFHDYLESLEVQSSYPGLQSVSYAPRIAANDLSAHLDKVRREGFGGYDVRPPGDRPEYAPVMYLEPFSGNNLRVFGFDTLSEPVRREALERARDTGNAAISRAVALVQDESGSAQAGALLFLPVYRPGMPRETVDERRKALNGWIAGSFRINDLINGIFGKRTDDLNISINEGESSSGSSLLYRSPHWGPRDDLPLFLETVTKLTVADRSWTVTIRPPAGFGKTSGADKAQLVAMGGGVLSLLLALFIRQLTTSRARALETARSMNRELIESETRYRQMFEGNSAVTYLLDPSDGRIIDANGAAATFWGYDLSELRTMSITQINTSSLERLQKVWSEIAERGNYIHEWQHRLKSGESRWVEVFGGPLSFPDKTLLYFIAHDITERKRAEEALALKQQQLEEMNALLEERVARSVDELRRKDQILIQQSRQAAMGEMINNIAHQWRQPLNSLGLVIQNTRYEYEAGLLTPEQMEQDMKLGMELIQFMSQTIDDFRTFFRKDKEIKRFSIAESIGRAVVLMEGSLMSHNIRIIRQVGDDLLIDGYPNEYSQALLNLLINARDALLDRAVENPQVTIQLGRDGDYALVTISDNAGGIPAENIAKIFDPYFTTKDQEKGTGIGLYMSKTIIEKHMGGSLEVANGEGGAEFRIRNRLPE